MQEMNLNFKNDLLTQSRTNDFASDIVFNPRLWPKTQNKLFSRGKRPTSDLRTHAQQRFHVVFLIALLTKTAVSFHRLAHETVTLHCCPDGFLR